MSDKLLGKNALVTGASGGIGRAIALHLAKEGASVAVHYGRGRVRAEETLQLIKEAGGSGQLVEADLRNIADIQRVAAGFAGGIDILVNNAGVARGQTLEHTTEDEFDAVFDTNVKATFFLTQALLPMLRTGASLINISSMVSIVAYPSTISYSMSKAALNHFTRSLAADLAARDIRVNGVAPGATDSEFLSGIRDNEAAMQGIASATAFGRLGTPDEIAQAVAFLASPESAWITGQILQVSGGMHL